MTFEELFHAQPNHILVAGDWHAEVAWGAGVLRMLPSMLPDEEPRFVIHAGDFGIWRGKHGAFFLSALDKSLRKKKAVLAFVDGNHEDFPLLHEMAGDTDPQRPVQVCEAIWWLPRGVRWTWHGRTWLAVGGAVSVDRVRRREGFDWFPEEEITEAQYRRITAAGHADVMVCHDAPVRVPLPLPAPPRWWHDRDLARSERHRERLQDIVDIVEPSHLLHGHYDIEHDTIVDMPHGPLAVTGLDKDGARTGNFRILDVRTMTFQPTPPFRAK